MGLVVFYQNPMFMHMLNCKLIWNFALKKKIYKNYKFWMKCQKMSIARHIGSNYFKEIIWWTVVIIICIIHVILSIFQPKVPRNLKINQEIFRKLNLIVHFAIGIFY